MARRRPETTHPAARLRQMLSLSLSRPVVRIAAAGLVAVILLAVFAPAVAPFNPNEGNYGALYQGPSIHHLLGTDQLGRDILSRLIFGARLSLVGVGEALAVYLSLGLVMGLLAGYLGGSIETFVVWVAEVSFGVPQIIVVLGVLSILSNDDSAAMLVLGLLGAPALAVLVLGAARAVREEQFIAAARVSGLHSRQIILRHILPMIAGPVIVQTSLFAGIALIFQTGVDFLGIGTQPPTASWGSMVAEASQYLARDPWMMMPAGLIVTLTVIAFGLLGDGVHDWHARLGMSPFVSADGEEEGRLAFVEQTAIRSAGQVAGESSLPERPVADMEIAALRVEPLPVEPLPGAFQPTRVAGTLLSVSNLSIVATSQSGAPVPLVDGVCLDLNPGDAVGIVGESGCGKTMTALGLMGLLPPGVWISAGTVTLKGMQVQDLGEKGMQRLRGSIVSMISQEPIASLDPSFAVGAQLTEVIRRHSSLSRAAARQEAIRLLELVELPDARRVVRSYPHQLSGGMAQRVAIAAALAGKPDLLIADEPTTALDVTVQAEILELLRTLRAETGLGLLLVSHDWGVIADSCESAVVMYAGQIVEAAGTQELFADPRHPYTRGLMTSNPHYATAPRTMLTAIPGSVPPVGKWPHGCRFASRCSFATDECRERPVLEEIVGDSHRVRCIHQCEVAALPAPGHEIHGV